MSTLTPSPSPKPTSALTIAWREAEAALLRFKATRDPADREAAAGHLLRVAECEALIIAKKHVDTKLPASFQRDKAEMAQDAASSVLTQERTRMTLLAEGFDPERATLRTLVGRMLFNKVMDYVRKEPLPGMVGRGSSGAGRPVGAAQTSSATPTLDAFCQSLAADTPTAPDNTGTLQVAPAPDDVAPAAHNNAALAEASHDDSNTTLAILREIEKMLTKGDDSDEAEVFACEFLDMTYQEGVDHINQTHAQQANPEGIKSREGPGAVGTPYMSLSTYKRKLAQARKTLAKHYPELGE